MLLGFDLEFESFYTTRIKASSNEKTIAESGKASLENLDDKKQFHVVCHIAEKRSLKLFNNKKVQRNVAKTHQRRSRFSPQI